MSVKYADKGLQSVKDNVRITVRDQGTWWTAGQVRAIMAEARSRGWKGLRANKV